MRLIGLFMRRGNVLALLLAVTFAVVAMSVSQQARAAADPSLMAHYTFDGSNANDSSGNNRHGTLVGSPTFASGPSGFGNAISLDLGKYVVLPGVNTLDLNNHDFTVTAWVNATAFSGLGGYGGDWAVLGNQTGPSGMHLVLRSGQPYMGFLGNDTGSGCNMSLNTWYHIAWQYRVSGGVQTIFVNGTQVASTGGHGAFNGGTGAAYIGRCCETWDAPRYAKGRIDDVKIFNRVLTPSEVAATVTPPPPPAPPTTCYDILVGGFSTGDGVYAIDPEQDGSTVNVYCDITTDGGGWTLAGYGAGSNLAGKLNVANGTYNPTNRSTSSANINAVMLARRSTQAALSWADGISNGNLATYQEAVKFGVPNRLNQTLDPTGGGYQCLDSSKWSPVTVTPIVGSPDLPTTMYTRTDSLGAVYGMAYGLVLNQNNGQCDWTIDGQPFKAVYLGINAPPYAAGIAYNPGGVSNQVTPATMAIWFRGNAAVAVNTAPTVSANSASVTADQGAAAAISGAYSDSNSGDNVSITASTGTVTKTGTNSGTWNWTNTTTAVGSYNVTITANDGAATATTSFTVTVKDAPPALTAGGTVTATGGGPAVVVDPNATITDPGQENLSGARVSIGAGFIAAQDSLGIQGQGGTSGTVGGLTWSYNSSTGVLTLSGSASPATYQAALRQVTYRNSVTNANTANRTITFTIANQLAFTGNGHFYEFVSSFGIPWSTALAQASTRSLYGMQGYLATITSSAENQFIFSKVQGNGWIGGSDHTSESIWKWVSGPEAGTTFCVGTGFCSPQGGAYTNWNGGEPNNAGDEDYAHIIGNPNIGVSGQGVWNDLPNTVSSGDYAPLGYVVEYGGMPGDPTNLQLTANATVQVVPGNQPPTVTVNAPTTTADEGGTNGGAGTYSDADAGQNVTITASVGTVTKTGVNSGSWSWSNPALDGAVPLSQYTVTITANDGVAPPATVTFTARVRNVAPTATFSNNGPVDAGSSFTLTLSGGSDASSIDAASLQYAFDCGSGSGYSALGSGNTASCATTVAGTRNVKGKVQDKDGGFTEYTATVTVNDPTPPVITPSVTGTLGDNGWYTSDVEVSWTVTDDESAVSSTSGCDTTTVSDDTAGTTITCSATSGGGTASESVTVKRDATAPTISGSQSPAANANGWNNTDVTVTFSCDDNLSGVASCVGDTTLTGEGAGQSASGAVTDNVGNTASATVADINIDTTAPTISGSAAPAPNGAGWNNTDVAVTFTCGDALSGVDSCTGDTVLTTDGAGQSATGTATDLAGNTASATVSGLNIDKTAPAVAITGVSNGAVYIVGGAPVAGNTCTDATSGVASSSGATTGGNANSVGSYTYTATCTDVAGNTTTVSASYAVTYGFSGFLQPIPLPVSTFKGGSTIPVKFRLTDASGAPVSTAIASISINGGPVPWPRPLQRWPVHLQP
ncbi:MAG: hypothetical protein FJ319_03495 [SAR202 cluster bacterium]|nr:hypothetical protein [SAR202 cluster bacterium]